MQDIPQAIFVHGGGGGGWEWSVWARVFAAHGWATHAPDLQPAARGLRETRIEDYVQQACAWCDAVPAPRVLIGASLGGLLALLAAPHAAPSALVLINPLPPAGVEPAAVPREHPPIVPWGSMRSLSGTRRALRDADAAACLYAFRRWRDESGAALNAAARGIAAAAPRCATLVLASEHDTDVPVATSSALARWCGAELRVLAGASHVGPLLGRGANACAAATLAWCAAALRAAREYTNPLV